MSSLNTTSASIIGKAKLIELLMLYHVFPQKSHTQPLYTKFLSAECMSSLRYFSSGDTLRKVQTQKFRAEMFDSGEDVKGVVHHQGLFYLPEIIRIDLTSGPLWH